MLTRSGNLRIRIPETLVLHFFRSPAHMAVNTNGELLSGACPAAGTSTCQKNLIFLTEDKCPCLLLLEINLFCGIISLVK